MAALAQAVSQEALVAEAVKTIAAPRGVTLSRIFFDTDHAGDRALRIVFAVSKRIPLTPARVRTLADFMNKVQEAASVMEFDAHPYVRLEDAA